MTHKKAHLLVGFLQREFNDNCVIRRPYGLGVCHLPPSHDRQALGMRFTQSDWMRSAGWIGWAVQKSTALFSTISKHFTARE